MRFALIDRAKAQFPVHRLLVLGVSQSGYFAWRGRPACRRQRDDMVLLAHVRSAFALSNATYDLVLPPQPLQLCRDIALCGRGVDSVPIPAPADPADQRRQPNPKITGDLALRATAGLRQADRFLLKFLRKPSLLCHRVPHSSLGTLHFSEASPG